MNQNIPRIYEQQGQFTYDDTFNETKHSMVHRNIIPLKYSFSRKQTMFAINKHTSVSFKCNKFHNLSNNLQVSNYIYQLLHFNIDDEIESNLLVNNQIHGHNIRSSSQMSISRVNGTKTKYCVLHNGIIMELFTWCTKSQRIIYGVHEKKCIFFSSTYTKILSNIHVERHFDCIVFCHARIYCFSNVITLGLNCKIQLKNFQLFLWLT